jgi:hypothetical protein
MWQVIVTQIVVTACWPGPPLRPVRPAKAYVTKVVVRNPRKTASLKDGSKSDRIDARKLAEPLCNRSLQLPRNGQGT